MSSTISTAEAPEQTAAEFRAAIESTDASSITVDDLREIAAALRSDWD